MIIRLVIFILWLPLAIKTILFHAYFWQLKEYRFDRVLAHLRLKTSWKMILPFFPKPFYRPKLTLRAGVIILGTILLIGVIGAIGVVGVSLGIFVLGLLALERVIVLAVPLLVFLTTPPFFLAKQLIIFWAKRKLMKMPKLLVIGITGSFGKTSTKEFLSSILAKKFKVARTVGTQNTPIGVAKNILKRLKEKNQIFIVEMGAYKKGEIKQICDIVHPQIGILTGVNEQHLGLFGSLENIKATKYELIESLPADGVAIFNGDNPYCRQLARKTKIKKILYRVEGVKVLSKRIEFTGKFNGVKKKFTAPLYGAQNAANIAAAVTAAREMGMSFEEIAKAIQELSPPPRTMEVITGINGVKIVDDTYNANPAGFLAALDYLRTFAKKRKVVITPGIIELGKESTKLHQQIGEELGRTADVVVLTSSNFVEPIKKGITKTNKRLEILIEEDHRKASRLVTGIAKKDDVILLEGRIPANVIEALK